MGSLSHFNLEGIRVVHGLHSFVETGTAHGLGVEQARAAGFEVIHSIEIVRELAQAAISAFAHDSRVTIWNGDSREVLPMILKDLPPRPALFWLDAHFPGAHKANGDYGAEPDVGRRLPLADEVRAIRNARGDIRDVLIIDDARIYQPGPYGAGDLPPDWPPLQGIERNLDFLREYRGTHGVVTDFADHGYVMVFPHQALKRAA